MLEANPPPNAYSRFFASLAIKHKPSTMRHRLRWVQMMMGLVVGYYLISAIYNGYQTTTYLYSAALVVWSITEYQRTRAKNIEGVCWLFVATAIFVVGALAMTNGQGSSNALWFFPVLPVMAGQLLGNRAVVISALASSLAVAGVLLSESWFSIPTESPNSSQELVILRFVSLAVCCGLCISAKRSFQIQANELDRRAQQLNKLRLERDQARRSASVFLASLSEHLQRPMSELVTQTKTIQRSIDQQRAHLARDAVHCVDGMHRLINDILDLSDLENKRLVLSPTSFRLSDLIGDLRTWFDAQPNPAIELQFNVPSEDLELTLDRSRLQQICTRLMENALKFSQAQALTISFGVSEDKSTSSDLVLQVSDNGIGISASCQAQVMERFAFYCDTQANQDRGAGISLVLLGQLTRAMGGAMSFEDCPKGTSVRVQLPANAKAPNSGDLASPKRTTPPLAA